MIDKSEQINELAAALSKAQSKFKHVSKDKTARIKMKNGGEYSYSYADLGSTWDVAREALTSNGLSVAQLPSFGDGWLMLDTMLMHSSGQYISSQMKTRADEMDVKSIGSAITYLRRYAFASITGLVADEDDDGSAPQQPQARSVSPQQHTNGNGNQASDKQLWMLRGVWKEGEFDGTLDAWIVEGFKCTIDRLTKAQASEAIEILQAQLKAGTNS